MEFLAEAEGASTATTPRMAIHAAYYAMFHGARATLLRIEGIGAPTKHNVVVSQFGYHAKQSGDTALTDAGRALNDAQQQRLRSDYNTRLLPTPADALTTVKVARSFLEACRRRYGFPAPV